MIVYKQKINGLELCVFLVCFLGFDYFLAK